MFACSQVLFFFSNSEKEVSQPNTFRCIWFPLALLNLVHASILRIWKPKLPFRKFVVSVQSCQAHFTYSICVDSSSFFFYCIAWVATCLMSYFLSLSAYILLLLIFSMINFYFFSFSVGASWHLWRLWWQIQSSHRLWEICGTIQNWQTEVIDY